MSNDPRLVALTLAVLSGCATEQALAPATEAPLSAPPTTTTATATAPTRSASDAAARIDENVARLQALHVFEVSAITAYGPPEAYHCYGICPGMAPQVAAARALAAERLDVLAPLAERAAHEGAADPAQCTPAAIDHNLAALRALSFATVGALVETVPQAEARCYNTPCPDAVARAHAENCDRASALARIVTGASTAIR